VHVLATALSPESASKQMTSLGEINSPENL